MKRVRLGMIIPSSNTVVEVDFARSLPPGLTLRVRRVGGAEVPLLHVVGEWLGPPPPPSRALRNLVSAARVAEVLAAAWQYVDQHPDAVRPGPAVLNGCRVPGESEPAAARWMCPMNRTALRGRAGGGPR